MALKVYFSQSEHEVEWIDRYGSLLELARENNMILPCVSVPRTDVIIEI